MLSLDGQLNFGKIQANIYSIFILWKKLNTHVTKNRGSKTFTLIKFQFETKYLSQGTLKVAIVCSTFEYGTMYMNRSNELLNSFENVYCDAFAFIFETI